MHLGELINMYRKEHKLSMDAFAKKSELSKAYISVLEKNEDPRTGKPIIPSIPTIEKVATAINVSFNDIFSKLDDGLLVRLDDGEIGDSTSDNDFQELRIVYDKLNSDRRVKVYDFATDQFNQQERILQFNRQSKDEKEVLIAAHIKEGVTEEGMEEILNFIGKVKKEQDDTK